MRNTVTNTLTVSCSAGFGAMIADATWGPQGSKVHVVWPLSIQSCAGVPNQEYNTTKASFIFVSETHKKSLKVISDLPTL